MLAQIEATQLVRRVDEEEEGYIFKHTLTQESIYESLLKTKRAELHLRVAHAIESLCGNDVETHAAVLAIHFERANVDDKAFTYSALAGDIAARSYAIQEALMQYDRALALASRSANPGWYAQVRQVFSNKGRVLEVGGNHAAAIENYESMIAFARRVRDTAMEADGLSRIITTQSILGNVTNADDKLRQALDLARQSGDQELIGRALWNLGLAIRFKKPLASIDSFHEALAHAEKAGLVELKGYILADLAVEMQFAGQSKSAKDYAEQSLETFRSLDNRPMIANALGNVAEANYARGDTESAREASREGSQISQMIGNPWGIGYNEWVLLIMDVDAGEFDQAVERGEYIMDISRNLGIPLFLGLTSATLARVYIETRQFERAQELMDAATKYVSFMDSAIWSGIAAGMSAHLAMSRGRLDEARELLAQFSSLDHVRSSNLWLMADVGPALAELAFADCDWELAKSFSNILIPRMDEQALHIRSAEMRLWRARASRALGESAQAWADLEQTREVAIRAKNRLLLWKTQAEIAKLAESEGKSELATASRVDAAETISVIRSHISDPIMRESFLARSDIKQIIGTSFSTINDP